MSERILRILLSELHTARLICQKNGCGAVIELPVEKIGSASKCPLCKSEFLIDRETFEGVFKDFADAIRRMKDASDHVQVEFILPEIATQR